MQPRSEGDLVDYAPAPCPADKCVADLVAGDLVITEIMKDPSAVGDSDGEFFEVYNASGGSVNLDGLALWDDGSDSETASSSDVFKDGEYIVFGNNIDSSANGGLTVDIEFGMSVGNSDDEIGLGDTKSPIDYVAYNDTDFPDTAGYSMQLDAAVLSATDNDSGENWCLASTSYGDGDFGTPGSVNDSCP